MAFRIYTSYNVCVFFAILIFVLYTLWFHDININLTFIRRIFKNQWLYTSPFKILRDTSDTSGWQPNEQIYEEQVHLRNISTIVALKSETIANSVPTVPCLSADGHLLVLSVGASRVRYGVSLTFIMIHWIQLKVVLPNKTSSKPLSAHKLSLWCIFDDGSVTPAYSYDVPSRFEYVSLVDCSLSSFASDQLWKYNQTLRVHLASTTDKSRNLPILKAFVSVPKPLIKSTNSSHEVLTLCTSPLHNKEKYLTQWIEFHRLVGFQKFVIYNTTDNDDRLSTILSAYAQKYPDLVDVIQWNFSSLALIDPLPTRYFQMEALHDCLIRYGDQSEWLGMIDLDEYIVPLYPYATVFDYIHDNFGRRIIGSIDILSQFFCTKGTNKYTLEENNPNRLVIERFVYRESNLSKAGFDKYLYRPRFVQYLSVHNQLIGLSREKPSENHIILAHYAYISSLRQRPGCAPDQYVMDTSIRDRFGNRVKNAITALAIKGSPSSKKSIFRIKIRN